MEESISVKALTCFYNRWVHFLGDIFQKQGSNICSNILSETNRGQKKQRDIFSLNGFLIYVKFIASKQKQIFKRKNVIALRV